MECRIARAKMRTVQAQQQDQREPVQDGIRWIYAPAAAESPKSTAGSMKRGLMKERRVCEVKEPRERNRRIDDQRRTWKGRRIRRRKCRGSGTKVKRGIETDWGRSQPTTREGLRLRETGEQYHPTQQTDLRIGDPSCPTRHLAQPNSGKS